MFLLVPISTPMGASAHPSSVGDCSRDCIHLAPPRPPWIRLAGTCGLGSASVFGFLFTSLYIGINTVSITTTTNACPTPTIRLCLPAHHVTLHCGASLSGDGDKRRPLIARLAVRTCEREHENNNENKCENNSNRSSMSLNRYFLCT